MFERSTDSMKSFKDLNASVTIGAPQNCWNGGENLGKVAIFNFRMGSTTMIDMLYESQINHTFARKMGALKFCFADGALSCSWVRSRDQGINEESRWSSTQKKLKL
jgi:hypothetical protein